MYIAKIDNEKIKCSGAFKTRAEAKEWVEMAKNAFVIDEAGSNKSMGITIGKVKGE